LFDNAGIAPHALKTVQTTTRFASATDLAHADIKGWFPFAGFEVSQADVDAIIEDLGREFAIRPDGDGGISFDVHAHIVTGTKS